MNHELRPGIGSDLGAPFAYFVVLKFAPLGSQLAGLGRPLWA